MKKRLVVVLLAVCVGVNIYGCNVNPYLTVSNFMEADDGEPSEIIAEKEENDKVDVTQKKSKEAETDDEGKEKKKTEIKSRGLKKENLSSDWSELEYVFDGKKYQLPTSYKEIEKNGWHVDMEDYGYKEGYTLNPGDQTFGSICLKNKNYNKKVSVKIGFVNHEKKAKDILKCEIWCMDLDVCYGFEKLDNIPDMTIAEDIHIGSSEKEVIAAFGEPEDKYVDKEYHYKTYYYRDPKTYQRMTLNIDAKKGVTRIALEKY